MPSIIRNDMENKDMGGKTCNCGHHKVFPILVILFGLAFLLGALNILTWSFVGIAWPILVIIAGASKFCKCC
jgi:hypothetical protein